MHDRHRTRRQAAILGNNHIDVLRRRHIIQHLQMMQVLRVLNPLQHIRRITLLPIISLLHARHQRLQRQQLPALGLRQYLLGRRDLVPDDRVQRDLLRELDGLT